VPKGKTDKAWYKSMFARPTDHNKKRYTFGDVEIFRSWGLPVDVHRSEDSEIQAGTRTPAVRHDRVAYKGRSDRAERAERKKQSKKQKTSANGTVE
jgi:hypothetical protein